MWFSESLYSPRCEIFPSARVYSLGRMRAPTRTPTRCCRPPVEGRRPLLVCGAFSPIQVEFLYNSWSWPEADLGATVAGDGKAGSCRSAGHGEAFISYPGTSYANDLRWVPPWSASEVRALMRRFSPDSRARTSGIEESKVVRRGFPAAGGRSEVAMRRECGRCTEGINVRACESDGLSAGDFLHDRKVIKTQRIRGNGVPAVTLRIPEMPERLWLKVLIWGFLVPRGSGLLKVRSLPIDDFLDLRLAIGRIVSLRTGFSMFCSDRGLEFLSSVVAELDLHDVGIHLIVPLVRVVYFSDCLTQSVVSSSDLMWKVYGGERVG